MCEIYKARTSQSPEKTFTSWVHAGGAAILCGLLVAVKKPVVAIDEHREHNSRLVRLRRKTNRSVPGPVVDDGREGDGMAPDGGVVIHDADQRIKAALAGQTLDHAVRVLVQADANAGIYHYEPIRTPFYQFVSPDGGLRFGLQLLDHRAARPREPRDSCPLDLEAIRAKIHQHWFTFSLLGREMVGLANPFAFLCSHVTIASSVHEPQFWRRPNHADSRPRIERAVRDLYTLASALPTFLVIYNASREVGASLPGHQHYQVAELPAGYGALALQQAAAKRPPALCVSIGFHDDYPVYAARFAGPQETVVELASNYLEKWERVLKAAASANLIALMERGEVVIYIVLRNALFRLAQGFDGVLGSLEMAGLLILSTEYEFRAVRERRFSFARVWDTLADVRPPEGRLLL
jgi:hypothetical protein